MPAFGMFTAQTLLFRLHSPQDVCVFSVSHHHHHHTARDKSDGCVLKVIYLCQRHTAVKKTKTSSGLKQTSSKLSSLQLCDPGYRANICVGQQEIIVGSTKYRGSVLQTDAICPMITAVVNRQLCCSL